MGPMEARRLNANVAVKTHARQAARRLTRTSGRNRENTMKRFAIAVLCALGGYVIAAFLGYFLIDWLSSNTHDRSVEAAMTSAFVLGPLGAVIAFVIGLFLAGGSSRTASAED
jgi:hypothetical protein